MNSDRAVKKQIDFYKIKNREKKQHKTNDLLCENLKDYLTGKQFN